MSKKMLKRSLALGALMAFVITGSAMAADEITLTTSSGVVVPGAYVVDSDTTVDADAKTVVGLTGLNKDKTTIDVLEGKTLTLIANKGDYGGNCHGVIANTTITGAGNIVLNTYGEYPASGLGQDSIDSITANSLSIYAENGWGIYATQSPDDGHTIVAKTINIDSKGHAVYANDSEVSITGFDTFTATAREEGSGILVGGNGTGVIQGNVLNVNADERAALGAIGGSTLEVSVNSLEAITSGLGTEPGEYRKEAAVVADAKSRIDIAVKDNLKIEVKDSAENADVYGVVASPNGGIVNLNGGNTADISIKVVGDGGTDGVTGILATNDIGSKNNGGFVEINAKSATIDVYATGTDAQAVWVANKTTDGKDNVAKVVINAENTVVKAKTDGSNYDSYAFINQSQGQIEVNGGLVAEADILLSTRGEATTIIDGKGKDVQLTGNIEFNYGGNTTVDSNVDIKLAGNNSWLNGNILKTGSESAGNGENAVTGMKLSLSDKAQWTTVSGESFVNTLVMNDGNLNVTEGTKVQIGVGADDTGWDGNGTVVLEKVNEADENGKVEAQVTINKKQEGSEVTVASAIADVDTMSDEEIVNELQKMKGNVVDDTEEEAADYFANSGESSLYDEVKIASNATGADALQKVVAAANYSVSDMAAISLMSWRAETNDMNKRMGELRNANGEHGVWARMVGGEDEYKSVEYEYTQYQLGYDEKLSTDPSWTVGVALSYTDGESTFAQGNGENTNKALSIYGSKLNDDGSFIDLIAKYARLENDFDTFGGMGGADYSTNGYSLSAEYGKRLQQGNGLWIEPQVELTYGKVSAVDYLTKKGVKVAQDGMESIVGRVGFSLGKDIKDGNVYARASYLYDFDGETSVSMNGKETLEQDLGGGWWEVGVGANINLSKATYIYADVEKTFGGEVDTNWQWNLGVRYSF